MFLTLLFIAATTFLAFNFMYRAYDAGALSLTSPVVNSYPIVAVIFSVFVLGASLPILAIVALAVVIVGIILVSTSLSELRNRMSLGDFAPGIRYALLAAVFLGLSFPTFGYASENLGYLLPAISTRAAAAAIGFVASRFLRQGAGNVKGVPWGRLLAMAVLESIGVASFSIGVIVSSYSGAIPILSTFGGMSVVFTVAYAMILLKEKLEINHIFGMAMVILGVATLLYLTG
jgi:drug/metabolite transporter (DMT)-like permease